MTLLGAKLVLGKIWAWIKAHWQLVVGLAIGLTLWLVFRRRDGPDLGELVELSRKSHQEEVDILTASYEKELVDREAARIRAVEALAQVEIKFAEAEKELTAKERKEVQKTIEKHKTDPDALTNELAALTGFTVVTDAE